MHNGHGGDSFISLIKTIVICIAVLIIVAPALAQIVTSLLPFILILAVIAVVLRLLWFYTGRW